MHKTRNPTQRLDYSIKNRARWDFGKSDKNHENVSWHKFFNVFLHNKQYLHFMFGEIITPSFANLHICNVKFFQCKSSLLGIDRFKYESFGNTNTSLVFPGWLLTTQWVLRHPTCLWQTTNIVYSVHNIFLFIIGMWGV